MTRYDGAPALNEVVTMLDRYITRSPPYWQSRHSGIFCLHCSIPLNEFDMPLEKHDKECLWRQARELVLKYSEGKGDDNDLPGAPVGADQRTE